MDDRTLWYPAGRHQFGYGWSRLAAVGPAGPGRQPSRNACIRTSRRPSLKGTTPTGGSVT